MMRAPTGKTAGPSTYVALRSILETPILDERKWAKVPRIPADAVLLDMEDSVPPAMKEEARSKVVEHLERLASSGRGSVFPGGKLALPRCNSLATPWGEDDLSAAGRAGATVLVYPKLHDTAELAEVRRILNAAGSDPDLFVIVETAQAVLELTEIARCEKVRALMFGPADLADDAGFELFAGGTGGEAAGIAEDSYHYARSKIVLCAAAYGLAAFDMVFVEDIRDLAAVSACANIAKRRGFTGMATFYPPHVDVINTVFSSSEAEVARARQVVEAYRAALEAGRAAVTIDGRAIIVQDYKSALRVLERAGRPEGSESEDLSAR